MTRAVRASGQLGAGEGAGARLGFTRKSPSPGEGREKGRAQGGVGVCDLFLLPGVPSSLQFASRHNYSGKRTAACRLRPAAPCGRGSPRQRGQPPISSSAIFGVCPVSGSGVCTKHAGYRTPILQSPQPPTICPRGCLLQVTEEGGLPWTVLCIRSCPRSGQVTPRGAWGATQV